MTKTETNSWQGPLFVAFTLCFLFAVTFYTHHKVGVTRGIASVEAAENYTWNFSYKF